jgi:hypothetical protein
MLGPARMPLPHLSLSRLGVHMHRLEFTCLSVWSTFCRSQISSGPAPGLGGYTRETQTGSVVHVAGHASKKKSQASQARTLSAELLAIP